MDAQGLHAMVCKKAPGKIARHHVFNDIIWRAVGAAGIPAVKEPSGLDRQDGKRPDGLTLISWHGGRSLVWDVTVVSPLAAFYVDRAATDAGTVADMTATRTRSSAIAEGPRDASCQLKFANSNATVQKLLIRQVLTKSMVCSWRFSRRQCVIDNVHSTMTRPSRLPLSQVS